jgi:hypothetical protein
LFRVRVNKIESTRDLDGNLGKRIELFEEREVNPYVLRPQSDEAKMAQDIMQALQQQMPFLPQRTQMATPKIILFLTEHEYDSLGITQHCMLRMKRQHKHHTSQRTANLL